MDSNSKKIKIGEGTFGKVYKVQKYREYAYKEINLDPKIGIHFTTLREIAIMQRLKHKNICKLKRFIIVNNTITLIMPFYKYDLLYFIKKKVIFKKKVIDSILYQILCGLKFLHSEKIIHRDIKPGNIFIDISGTIKIGDFNITRELSSHMTCECTTLVYRPLEQLVCKANYNTFSDIWSLGCIFYELFEHKPPFVNKNEVLQICEIISKLNYPDEDYKFLTLYKNLIVNERTTFYFDFFAKHDYFNDDNKRFFFCKTLHISYKRRYSAKKLLETFFEKFKCINILKYLIEN